MKIELFADATKTFEEELARALPNLSQEQLEILVLDIFIYAAPIVKDVLKNSFTTAYLELAEKELYGLLADDALVTFHAGKACLYLVAAINAAEVEHCFHTGISYNKMCRLSDEVSFEAQREIATTILYLLKA